MIILTQEQRQKAKEISDKAAVKLYPDRKKIYYKTALNASAFYKYCQLYELESRN